MLSKSKALCFLTTLLLALQQRTRGQSPMEVETSTNAIIYPEMIAEYNYFGRNFLSKTYYHRDEGPPSLEANILFAYKYSDVNDLLVPNPEAPTAINAGDVLAFNINLISQQVAYYNETNPEKEVLSLDVYDVYDDEDSPNRHIEKDYTSTYARLDNLYGQQTEEQLIVKVEKSTAHEGDNFIRRVPRTYLVFKIKDTDQAEGDQLIRQIELAFTNGSQYPLLDVPGHQLIVGQPILVYAETGIPLPLSATESVEPLRTVTPATLHCLIEANPPRLKLTADAAEDSVPSTDRTSWFEYKTSNDLISWTPISQDALLEDQILALPLTTDSNEKIFVKAFKVVESETYDSSGMNYGRY